MRRASVVAAALVAFVLGAPGAPGAQTFELPVQHHRTFGSGRGTLAIDATGVEYRTADTSDARHWAWDEIRQIQVVSPGALTIRTYEDQGWVRLWRDRPFDFKIEKGKIGPDLVAFLLAHVRFPVMTAVLPEPARPPRYVVPVKEARARRGRGGELVLFDEALAFRSPDPGASRYWRFTDLASVFRVNRFLLEVTAYEGGAGRTQVFRFQLKRDVEPEFFDTLWARVNPGTPLRGAPGGAGVSSAK